VNGADVNRPSAGLAAVGCRAYDGLGLLRLGSPDAVTTLFSTCSADAQRRQAVQWTGWPRRRQDPGGPRWCCSTTAATACAGLSRWPIGLRALRAAHDDHLEAGAAAEEQHRAGPLRPAEASRCVPSRTVQRDRLSETERLPEAWRRLPDRSFGLGRRARAPTIAAYCGSGHRSMCWRGRTRRAGSQGSTSRRRR
jgi:hypothetical protein